MTETPEQLAEKAMGGPDDPLTAEQILAIEQLAIRLTGAYEAMMVETNCKRDAQARLAEAEKELSTTKVERDAWLVAAKANGDDFAAAEARLAEAESANRTGFYYKKWAAAVARLAEAEKANVGLSCSITELGEERDRYRLGCEAALAHAQALRMDTPGDERVRLALIEVLQLALDPEQKP